MTAIPIGQFRDAIQSAGLIPPDMIEADGKLRRFPSNGHRADDSGWYVFHDDGIPAGAFGDWRSGQSQTWRADIGRTLTPAEEAAHRAKVEAMQREREAAKAREQAEAASKAAAIWKAAIPAGEDHPYLTRKGIKASGARLHNGALVIPMHDGSELHSLQFIGPDGDKRFLTGGRVTGCYFSIGTTKGAAALAICEGFATGATIHEATGYPVAVAFTAGNLEPVAKSLRAKLPDLRLILCADDDVATEGNPGITKAKAAARAVGGLVAIPDFGTDRLEGATDFNDMAAQCGKEAVARAVASASAPATGEVQPGSGDAPVGDPEPLPALPDVQSLNYGALPPVLRAYLNHKPERMQCPADFAAVACVAMAGTAIGRKIGIRPKRADNWTVIANQWAMIVGRPGIMKSPAMSAALAPMRQMQAEAFKAHESAVQDYEVKAKLAKIQGDEAERSARVLMKEGKETQARLELQKAQQSVEQAPTARRLIINDSTVEALAETLEENPNGILVDRDELVGWLKSLDKEGQQEARAFYLTAAEGDKGFTTDRIGRGRGRHIAAVCVSIVGAIQPGVLASYVRETQRGGSGDDGLLQRFGLVVYPDISPKWKNIDRAPDQQARHAVDALISRLCALDPVAVGAEIDDFQPIPYLRFDPAAQTLFNEWREELEVKVRGDDEHPAIVSHLSKYRKLVPGLALINHLCEGGTGPVTEQALARALTFADYLESHARRVYSYASRPDVDGAKTILAKIKGGKLPQRFKASHVYRPGWSGLTTPEEAWPAIRLLVDYGYLLEIRNDQTGGRPSQEFEAHPSVRRPV